MKRVKETWHCCGVNLLLPRCVRARDGLGAWAGKKGFLGLWGIRACARRTRLTGLASHLSLSGQRGEARASSQREEGRFAMVCMRAEGLAVVQSHGHTVRGWQEILAAVPSSESMAGVAEQKQLERKHWHGWHLCYLFQLASFMPALK